MITQRDLECEIKELQLEIEDHQKAIDKLKTYLERKELQLKEMTNQTPCNYRTPTKYNVEYLDDKMVIVNGVQYQKVEEPKPQTLLEYFNSFGIIGAEGICNIVAKWLPDEVIEDGEDYNNGWNDCLQHLKENLK